MNEDVSTKMMISHCHVTVRGWNSMYILDVGYGCDLCLAFLLSIHQKGLELQRPWVPLNMKPMEHACITSWWFQPIWKILVKIGIFPKIVVKIKKNVWNHQLGIHMTHVWLTTTLPFKLTRISPKSWFRKGKFPFKMAIIGIYVRFLGRTYFEFGTSCWLRVDRRDAMQW